MLFSVFLFTLSRWLNKRWIAIILVSNGTTLFTWWIAIKTNKRTKKKKTQKKKKQKQKNKKICVHNY